MPTNSKSILDTPIEYLKGVGPIRADLLKKELGIYTALDLLQSYPFRHTSIPQYGEIKYKGLRQ